MAIFKCSCGYSKELDDSQIGKKGKCPKCQTVVTVITNISEEEEKTVTTTTEESSNKNKVPKSSGFFKCPHCNKSIGIEDLNLGKGDIGSIISNLEKSIKGKFAGVDTEKISETLKEGGKYYLYVLYGILLISVLSVIVLTGGIGNKINNIIYLLVIWSVLFVYVDATHNKIGKIPGKKGLLNNSAGVWSIGTLLLWIVVFPLYLINRKKLIEGAKENPQEIPGKRKKIVIAFISVVFALVLFNVIFSSGVNFSGSPSCSDSDVKKIVLDISTREIKTALLHQAIITELGTAPHVQGNPTYEYWNSIKDKDENIKKVINVVDKQMKDINMGLTGIRTDDKNENTKKCQCGAQLTSATGQPISIQYTAQYTEDGQVYVEVFGLK